MSSLNRATAPGECGLTAVGTSRIGAAFPPLGQKGNGHPAATHPHCVNKSASTSSAQPRSRIQSSCDSDASSTTCAYGALGRPVTRQTSPSRSPRQSASASDISTASSDPTDEHVAPAHATNSGAD